MVRAQVRVKRWGKSPPRRQQCRRHGKPRVVQDQIGGEGWPGPLSLCSLQNGASRSEGEPSGRLLEPHREVRPRGMIVAARYCKVAHQTKSGLQAHPLLFTNLQIVWRNCAITATTGFRPLFAFASSVGSNTVWAFLRCELRDSMLRTSVLGQLRKPNKSRTARVMYLFVKG